MMFRRPPPPEPSEHDRRLREAEQRRGRTRATISQRPAEEVLRDSTDEELQIYFEQIGYRGIAQAFTWLRDGGTSRWQEYP